MSLLVITDLTSQLQKPAQRRYHSSGLESELCRLDEPKAELVCDQVQQLERITYILFEIKRYDDYPSSNGHN
jgi:hypothetical protein